jgi:signal transduction histidine kinase
MSAQRIGKIAGDSEGVLKLSLKIVENINRTDRMIRDLLDGSRIKAGEELPSEIKECNLSEIAQATLG